MTVLCTEGLYWVNIPFIYYYYYTVGLSDQRRVGLDWYEFLCFEVPLYNLGPSIIYFTPCGQQGPISTRSNISQLGVRKKRMHLIDVIDEKRQHDSSMTFFIEETLPTLETPDPCRK